MSPAKSCPRLYREYRGVYTASGPGGYTCPCCGPDWGPWAKAKAVLHRYLRRKSRQELRGRSEEVGP